MRLYLAGLFTNGLGNADDKLSDKLTQAEDWHRLQVPNYLESYHYIHRDKFVEQIKRADRKVFLDSGAFSAFTMNVDVDIEAYCRYIIDNIDIIEVIDGNICASVLDGIGSAQKTYENQNIMESLGVRPMPCFHYGEDERYLEYYIDNYSHITIGGMVPISSPQLHIWLDRIWDKYLTDENGIPKLKVHGFGLTSVPLMAKYPWYSVDSSSWVQIASNGGILYTGNWKAVQVSDKSPARKLQNQHYDNFTPMQQEAIRTEIEKYGYDVERCRTDYYTRWSYNCMAFTLLEREMNESKPEAFKLIQPGLF